MFVQVEVREVIQKVHASNKKYGWGMTDKVGEPDFFLHLIQGTFSLDPLKLGGNKKISGASQICWKSQ